MTELLTAAQMRALEQTAMDSGSVSGRVLMERAGQATVQAIFDEWPELATGTSRAVVLCGPGNNGGDGFVVARLLRDAGWQVDVFLYGTADDLPPDAGHNHDRWVAENPVHPLTRPVATAAEQRRFCDAASHLPDLQGRKDSDAKPPFLVIDALFGIGLTRPITGLSEIMVHWDYLAMWRDLNNSRLVAIDIPSGICSDSGRHLFAADPVADPFPAAIADLTVTFHRPKLGHVLQNGPSACGKLRCVDIGVSSDLQPSAGATTIARRVTEPTYDLAKRTGHKFSYGHGLVLSGGPGQTGAARLAARAALRVGAGLVTLGVPPAAQLEAACHLTSIMLKRVPDAAALSSILEDARITALCLGPAMGLTSDKSNLIAATLQATSPRGSTQFRGIVLDADALTLIAADPALFKNLHEGCVLTPHMGEFARLFPDLADRLSQPASKGPAFSKRDATAIAATRAGCTVLLKGSDTVVASADGTASSIASHDVPEAAWLATAGSGDVLAGLITGLLARGGHPQAACETAAWLHVECARHLGPGLIADDLPDALGAVFQAQGV